MKAVQMLGRMGYELWLQGEKGQERIGYRIEREPVDKAAAERWLAQLAENREAALVVLRNRMALPEVGTRQATELGGSADVRRVEGLFVQTASGLWWLWDGRQLVDSSVLIRRKAGDGVVELTEGRGG